MCDTSLYSTTHPPSVLLWIFLGFTVEKELEGQLVCPALYLPGYRHEEIEGARVDQWTLLSGFSIYRCMELMHTHSRIQIWTIFHSYFLFSLYEICQFFQVC